MSNQIRPSVTHPTIATLYNDIAGGLLILAPEFQRKFVWTQAHQEEFLDTILQGYPFPEVYVSTGSIDIEAMKTVRNVIDGQQRLTTIKNYIDGRFEKPLTLVRPYEALNNTEKSDFLSYEVVVRDLGRVDDKTVREIFRRINLTKFKLDAVEIHNAVYDGAFISTGKLILDTADISVFGVFRETEFSRMADLHFVLQVMTTLEIGGYFTQDSEVETYIERFNDEYPNRDDAVDRIGFAFNTIRSLDLDSDSMWFRKSNFFTLVCELAINKNALRADLKSQLLDLERQVMDHKQKPETPFGQYYSYMYQSTNARKARVVRSEMFRKMCKRG